jgi:3-methyladenine DNA glycosylase/8-oxoguanine DNA glycosylase
MVITLPAAAPFRFESVVQSHGWYQLAPFTWDERARALARVERLSSGRVVVMTMRAAAGGLHVAVPGRLPKSEASEIARKAAWMFMLDADFDAFYALADGEPRLAHCRSQAHGRLLRSSSLFEDVVKVMLTTNIQWSGTKRLAAALATRYGEPLDVDPAQRAFPEADVIARSRESTLRGLGLGYRAPYLLQLARGVASGATDLVSLNDPARATADVRRDLQRLPGIGPYAAAILLGILRRYDFIGVDSQALSNVSKGFYGGKPVGPKEVETVFGRWGPYRSLAYWFWDWEGQQQSPMEAYESRTQKAAR